MVIFRCNNKEEIWFMQTYAAFDTAFNRFMATVLAGVTTV